MQHGKLQLPTVGYPMNTYLKQARDHKDSPMWIPKLFSHKFVEIDLRSHGNRQSVEWEEEGRTMDDGTGAPDLRSTSCMPKRM